MMRRSLERAMIDHSLAVEYHPGGNPRRREQKWHAREILPSSDTGPGGRLFVDAWGKSPRLAVDNLVRLLESEKRMTEGG